VTLSFWVKSPKTGVHSIALKNSAQDRSYVAEYTISSADTWERQSISIAGDTSGTWLKTNGVGLQVVIALMAGTDFTKAAGSWGTGNNYASDNQVNCVDNTSNNFYFTGVQLEIGSSDTPFEFEPYQTTLQNCQRYYTKRASANALLYGSSVTGTGVNYSHWQFHVPMRAAPTMTGHGGGSSGNTQQQISVDSGGSYAAAGTYATWGNDSTADAEL
jgi:hypothetical protein